MKRLLATLLSTLAVLTSSAVSVVQGYHTTGRGVRQALLLRIDLDEDLPAIQLTFSLKGNTPKLVKHVALYASDGDEFYADEAPTLLGQQNASQRVAFTLPHDGRGGRRRLWLTASIKEKAKVGEEIDAALTRIDYADGSHQQVPDTVGDPVGAARIFNTWSMAFVPTTDSCRFYRIPAMVVDRRGQLLVAADRRYDSNADLGDHRIDVAVRRSADGGRTWTPQLTIARGDGTTAAGYGFGDPALALTPTGRIICIMAAGRNNYFRGMRHMGITMSDDNGLSWTPVRQLMDSAFTDETHALTDSLGFYSIFTTSGRGLTTHDGTIMFTTNTLPQNGTYTSDCYILASADNGQSWHLGPHPAFLGGDESKLVQLMNDSLLISVRRSGERGFNTAGSDAQRWGRQWNNADITNGNACNADMLRLAPGVLLHTYLKHPTDRANLTLAMSTDEGRTWRDVMNIQPGQAAYSTMALLPNGDVALLFEDASYHAGNGYAITYVTIKKKLLK